jgi:hypothetical protein
VLGAKQEVLDGNVLVRGVDLVRSPQYGR